MNLWIFIDLDVLYEKKKTLLCVGLDPDVVSITNSNFEGSIFSYNKLIIDACAPYVLAFKPQFAHYAAYGLENELYLTIAYIKLNYPDILVILDSKRGDVGHTADKYALESFERYKSDCVTLNPYLGFDSISPFLKFKNKCIVVLARTSNESASIQDILIGEEPLYLYYSKQIALKTSSRYLSFVVGATCLESLEVMAGSFPEHWFLVPGIGAQGGTIGSVLNSISRCKPRCLLSLSRSVLSDDYNEKIIFDYARSQVINYLKEI